MLTRHLYRYDEVRAALLWCIINKRITEGIYWAQELLDSECYDELFQILFEGWIWSVGVSRLEWFHDYWALYTKPDVNEDELLLLTSTLMRMNERDSSVLFLLLQGPFSKLERLPPTPKTDLLLKQMPDFIDTPLKEALVRTMHLGKAVNAWSLATYLVHQEGNDILWDLIKRLDKGRESFDTIREAANKLFPDDATMGFACQALAVGFLCLNPKAQAKSRAPLSAIPMDSHTQTLHVEWKALEGRRTRRVYSPPDMCLSWLTSRGCNPYTKTTIKEVRNLSIDVLREKGCPFWQGKLDEYDPWSDDTAFENFWDDLFPDDIPDEWSLADQKKSHGPGMLRPDETPLSWKLIQKWFLRVPSVLIWNVASQINTLCQHEQWKGLRVWTSGLEVPYENLDDLEDLFQSLNLCDRATVVRFEVLGDQMIV